jgi:putative CocE/NonD family hydrolase
MGKSWGGFNALQIAARRPPALKAIITVCSTDDRYADDVHYMGGCLLNDNLWWGSIMLAYQARPPDPVLVGESWRAQWLKRLEAMPFWPALWLRHQRRDAYWRHGSVCEDFSAITCPVLAVGGWLDAYTNAIPRLLRGLNVPRLGIIGPWAHNYPHDGRPGPAIGFLQEAVRWWDQWLKNVDTGIMSEPMLRAYIEDWSPPTTWRDPAPGRWVGERTWPSPGIAARRWHLTAAGLKDTAGVPRELALRSPHWTGAAAGEWMGVGIPGEMPADQRIDDGFSLIFDSAALESRVELLGTPEIVLDVKSDKPVAQLIARLCDIAPDGSSRRVSYGVLNLTHRDDHAAPSQLERGQFYRVRLALNDCGYAFPPGHRIRLSLSTSYWPLFWPAPEPATLTVSTAAATLALPVRASDASDAAIRFLPVEQGPMAPISRLAPGCFARETKLDLVSGTATYVTDGEGGVFGDGVIRFDEIGTVVNHSLRRELSIHADDPLCAYAAVTQAYDLGNQDWKIRIEVRTEMTATQEEFRLTATLNAYESSALAAARHWNEAIPRDLV